MPVVDLRVMKRALTAQPVPVDNAVLTVTAVRATGPFAAVVGQDVVFSFAMTVSFADGAASDEIHLEPTDGSFGYEWEIVAESQMLMHRLTDAPDVDRVDFADLQDLVRSTLQPTDDNIAAWQGVITQAEGILGQTATARDEAAAAAAEARSRTVTATIDPTDPAVLLLEFPSFMLGPDGSSVLLPLEVTP